MKKIKKNKSLYLGQEIGFKTSISNSQIDLFAKISGDNNYIHMNKKKSIERGFEDRVVHGAYIIALFSRIIGRFLPTDSTLLLFMDTKFKNPAYPNKIIKIYGVVKEFLTSTNCITINLTAKYNRNGKIISTSTAIVRIK